MIVVLAVPVCVWEPGVCVCVSVCLSWISLPLSTPPYAVSQMDGDNYVPLSVISNFNQVRVLHSLDPFPTGSIYKLDISDTVVLTGVLPLCTVCLSSYHAPVQCNCFLLIIMEAIKCW